MARIRTIKPDFFTSDDVCSLKPLARLLYIGLWCEADREGRMVWAPRAFKRRYLPEDKCDIEEICQELVNRRLVILYGSSLAFIPTFAKHQHVNPREAQSTLPSPGDLHAQLPVSDASVTRREEGKEREGTEGKESLPLKRKTKLPEDWTATEDQLTYASNQGCPNPRDTAENFKLYHLKEATLSADWGRSWQYWCRNEKNFRRPPSEKTPHFSDRKTVEEPWEQRVNAWRQTGKWNLNHGPAPGESGCVVPKQFLGDA